MTGCWSEIEKLAGRTLFVLAQRKPFDVVEVTDSYAVVRPHVHNINRRIPRREIEDSCADLVAIGQITARQIQQRHADWHSAFVSALLAELPGISYSLNPITLFAGTAHKAQLAFDGDSAFIPSAPPVPAEAPVIEPPAPAGRPREYTTSGKRMEFVVIAELLRRGYDVYQTLVADQGFEFVLRLGKETGPCYLDIQIEARSKDVAPAKAARFAAMDISNPRPDYFFIFYAEQVDTFWVVPSLELVELASQNKRGVNKGKYTIDFCLKRAGRPIPDPQYAGCQDAFHRLDCG